MISSLMLLRIYVSILIFVEIVLEVKRSRSKSFDKLVSILIFVEIVLEDRGFAADKITNFVSILIFVEIVLEDCSQEEGSSSGQVSILIFVEIVLEVSALQRVAVFFPCFNPYFRGDSSGSWRGVSSFNKSSTFQSLFSWR